MAVSHLHRIDSFPRLSSGLSKRLKPWHDPRRERTARRLSAGFATSLNIIIGVEVPRSPAQI
jgi:hypothetical protein